MARDGPRGRELDAIGSLALLPASFALVGVVADQVGARPVFAVAGLGAAVLMAVGFLVPGVGDYRALAQPMLAGDIQDGSEGSA